LNALVAEVVLAEEFKLPLELPYLVVLEEVVVALQGYW
jgi:hypothetical protein